MYKICSVCNSEKELSSVYYEPRKNTKDGFRNQCRDCRNIDRRKRYVPSENNRKWTEEEKKILITHYPFESSKEIHEKFLPDRTPEQITDFAVKNLKLQKDSSFHKSWNQEQIAYLKSNYSDINNSVDEIAKIIGKSTTTITAMANSLGIFRDEFWNEEEKNLVETYYSIMQTSELRNSFLQNKTVSQITRFANDNGLFKTEQLRNEIRKDTAINNLNAVNGKKEPTKPELNIIETLNKLNISYIFQDFKKYYWVDFYLPEKELIIEVQGDYFHCNPLINLNYNILNKNKIIAKDKRKHSYFKNKNINVLYLWEYDIKNSKELCEKLIKKYIDNNGELENYHSFNYSLLDGKLKTNESFVAIGY